MRLLYLLLTCIFMCSSLQAQTVKIVSWNTANWGKSKSAAEINFAAQMLRDADIITLQEVVASPPGPQAVADLDAALDRTGADWDYIISPPTTEKQNGVERYAFLWKNHKVKLQGKPWLDQHYEAPIEREPYMATFIAGKQQFTLVSFHAVPKKKQPEEEIRYLKFFPATYPSLNLIFCGDFNLSVSNPVFSTLRQNGYNVALTNQKTTLRDSCQQGDCLANAYDNFLYPSRMVKLQQSGAIHFYKQQPSMRAARHLSDHMPVWVEIAKNEN